MRLKPLNTLCSDWSDISDEYLIGDDGHLYRRLKSGYCRSKEHPYQQIRATFGSKRKHTIKLHKAVALAFCKRPDGATDIDHIDNNKLNNRATNLQWLTHAENLRKRITDNAKGKET